MKLRWLWFWLCIVLGLMLIGCGLLVPAHLRAVDVGLIHAAGRSGAGLLERGQSLADSGRLGAAELYSPAARQAGMAGWDRFGATVTNLIRANPAASFWGNDPRTPALFNSPAADNFGAFIVRIDNRNAALNFLGQSSSAAVEELLRTRRLNALAIFTPSSAPGGQVFDSAIAETGLLLDGDHLATSLSDNLLALALQANRSKGTEPLEEALEDFISLAERFNWDQLCAFSEKIPDVATLHQLAAAARSAGDHLPALYAAVQLSGDPAAAGKYITHFSHTGLQDMTTALCYGADGERALVRSQQRLYWPDWLRWTVARDPFGSFYYFAAACSLAHPWLMLVVKWFCYLLAGFLFATAMYVNLPLATPLERPLHVRGVGVFQKILFASGFLLIVLLLSEPFLAQEHQEGDLTFRLHLPMAGGAAFAGITGPPQTIMNILLTMLLFFVLQALIYLACLLKLAEVRRQHVPPRIKLKLLENEEHLFDAGLYLGFVGTIVSLILASLGKVHFSLMAAYSATCFGIIFVIVFKIFSLRPARRQLLLEAEAEAAANATPPVTTP